MMPQEMPQENAPSLDMIKQALMKVIDDMTAMESDRHLPDNHPMKAKPPVAPVDGSEESPDLDMSGTSEDAGSDDPKMLESLMGEADKADADGSMPEDRENDLPPEIMDVVNRKKAELGK